MQYLVYARRSTDDPNNQKNSIEYQLQNCQKHANSNRLQVVDVTIPGFCERGIIKERHTAYKTAGVRLRKDGVSEYKIERPKFQRLMTMVAKDRDLGILCLCWDRLSRNANDGAIIMDLWSRGVDVRFVQANYERTSSGALHMDIDGMFAAHYSRVVSEKIRLANVKLRAEGKCTYRGPIGYLDLPGEKVPDPARAPIIKLIFEKCARGGWSLAQLAVWAASEGLTTKPARPKRTAEEMLAGEELARKPVSLPVNAKTIENILANPFYAGFLKHKGQQLPGAHEPIISGDLFEKAQKALNGRCTHVHYVDKPFFTYRGMVRCVCGRSYTPYEQKNHTYYRAYCRPGCTNREVNLNEETIHELVDQVLDRLHFADRDLREIARRAPKALPKLEQKKTCILAGIERKRVRLQRDVDYLRNNKVTLLREGAYGPASYAHDLDHLERELEVVTSEKAKVEDQSPARSLDTVLRFLELLGKARTSFKEASSHRRRKLAELTLLELSVAGGRLASVRAKEGFQQILDRPGSPSGGADYVFHELSSLLPFAEEYSRELRRVLDDSSSSRSS